MATWISAEKAEKFPLVLRAYKTIAQFRAAVAAAVPAGVWARRPPSLAGVSRKAGAVQVDAAAIPGVSALRKNGRKA